MIYNAGVLSFQHKSPLIQNGHKIFFSEIKKFLGDTEILNRTLFEEPVELKELPPFFNQCFLGNLLPETIIIHYTTNKGKEEILRSILM